MYTDEKERKLYYFVNLYPVYVSISFNL